MILVIFLVALIGSILIGLPICFALLFSGVCMMIGLNGFNSILRTRRSINAMISHLHR